MPENCCMDNMLKSQTLSLYVTTHSAVDAYVMVLKYEEYEILQYFFA